MLSKGILMNLYIDCEWNSFGGDLISMALVSDKDHEFYEVLGCNNPDPWVELHVMPILLKEEVTKMTLQYNLGIFLSQFDKVNIVADWPEDLMWFCRMLITGPGERLNTPPLTMEVIRVNTISKLPHNALEDARALKKYFEVA